MTRPRLAREVLERLTKAGLGQAEVFLKSGRTRHFELREATGAGRPVMDEMSGVSEESGWAVRAGDEHGSFFACGVGDPDPSLAWPAAEGTPLALPVPRRGAPWNEPADFSSPLMAEREAFALFASVAQTLGAELPGARLSTAHLDDGASTSTVRSSRGVDASWSHRLAALRLEAVGPGGASAVLAVAERDARRFQPSACARRLADLLAVVAGGGEIELRRAPMLLAPVVVARVLAGLSALWIGSGARKRGERLEDREGRLASEAWTVIDDGRLAKGALLAPYDGEGIGTREAVLVEGGILRRTLEGNPVAEPVERSQGGGVRRASWRDVPAPGPSHLYLKPDGRTSVASLLAGLDRGYFWLDAPSPGMFDLEGDIFELPVAGFALEGGRVRSPIAGARLRGSPRDLLGGLRRLARDLVFSPFDGMIGAPSALFDGLEVVAERGGEPAPDRTSVARRTSTGKDPR